MIRKAQYDDIEDIMTIVHEAQLSLRELGIDQWQNGYPSSDSIREDIDNGVGHLLLDDGNHPIGYSAIVLSDEEAYLQLAPSAWHTSEEYVVVHRLCVLRSACRSGAATLMMRYAADVARNNNLHSFRIDTHRGNIRMLAMLKKFGFEYCGIIYYPSGERLAYDLDIDKSKIL